MCKELEHDSANKKNTNNCNNFMHVLNSVAFLLLDSDLGSFNSNLFKAMGILAVAVDVDRMYIWKNHMVENELYATQVYEWSGDAPSQQDNEYTVDIPYSAVAPDWEDILSKGGTVNRIVREMHPDARNHLSAQGIISILVLPVFLESRFWGFVGFDDCRRERVFSDEEETILRSCSLLFAHSYNKNSISREIAEVDELKRTIFSHAPIGMTVFDDENNIVECNDAVLAMYGVTKDFYVNNFFDLSPEYQIGGMKSRDLLNENHKHVLSGQDMRFEWLHQTPDGKSFPCEISLTHVKVGDKCNVLSYTYDLRPIKRLEAELDAAHRESHLDPLTCIYNRRYFDEELPRVIAKHSRAGSTLGLLMLDIDFFKQYNDAYGHQEGDECLKKVAAVINKSLRRTEDFVARYGGEEFVAVLHYTDESGVVTVAKKILNNFRKANIPYEKSLVANYVTVSIGGTSGTVKHTQTKDDYVKVADEMLYASKQSGRNKYSFKGME